MRNQYMAKVLVHNKMVSEDQVNAYWGEITDSQDIGQVLVWPVPQRVPVPEL